MVLHYEPHVDPISFEHVATLNISHWQYSLSPIEIIKVFVRNPFIYQVHIKHNKILSLKFCFFSEDGIRFKIIHELNARSSNKIAFLESKGGKKIHVNSIEHYKEESKNEENENSLYYKIITQHGCELIVHKSQAAQETNRKHQVMISHDFLESIDPKDIIE